MVNQVVHFKEELVIHLKEEVRVLHLKEMTVTIIYLLKEKKENLLLYLQF
jgi:hypothetical protein